MGSIDRVQGERSGSLDAVMMIDSGSSLTAQRPFASVFLIAVVRVYRIGSVAKVRSSSTSSRTDDGSVALWM